MSDSNQKAIQPKQRWLKATLGQNPSTPSDSSRWADYTDTPLFRDCTERALLEYVMQQVPDPVQPAIMALKLQGAKEVLKVLLNLADPTPVTTGQVTQKSLTPINS